HRHGDAQCAAVPVRERLDRWRSGAVVYARTCLAARARLARMSSAHVTPTRLAAAILSAPFGSTGMVRLTRGRGPRRLGTAAVLRLGTILAGADRRAETAHRTGLGASVALRVRGEPGVRLRAGLDHGLRIRLGVGDVPQVMDQVVHEVLQ